MRRFSSLSAVPWTKPFGVGFRLAPGRHTLARSRVARLALAALLVMTAGFGFGTAGIRLLGADRAQAQGADRAQAQGKESAAGAAEGGEKLTWAAEFAQWPRITGYILSRNHGSRLVAVRATPQASADLLMANAQRVRYQQPLVASKYPVGTLIAMETWEVGPDLIRGTPGPIFFMRKEAPGYDPDGGDWRYAMTRADLTVLADGKDGRSTACRACHATLRDRDFVSALDR